MTWGWSAGSMLVLIGGSDSRTIRPSRGVFPMIARSTVPNTTRYPAGLRLMATHLGFGVVVLSPAGDRTCRMLRTH
jgi:hypothetical protein